MEEKNSKERETKSEHSHHSHSEHHRERGDRDRGSRHSNEPNTQIYIGYLPRDVRRRELEDEFKKFGSIYDCNVKGRYAFMVKTFL